MFTHNSYHKVNEEKLLLEQYYSKNYKTFADEILSYFD